jgi:hypothetical protein
MSVYCTTRVWKKSKATGNDKLVLLAIADNAWEDGTNAFPSVGHIAHKTGLDKRTVKRIVKKLIEIGELKRQLRHNQSSLFTVLIQDSWPDNPMNIKIDDDEDDEFSVENSVEVVGEILPVVAKKAPVKKKSTPAVKKERLPDPVWDAVMDVCGIDQTTLNQSERSKYGGCCKLLKESQATSDEIYVRAQRYRKRYEGIVLTPAALVNHWSSLSQDDVTAQAVPAGWDAIKEARKQRGA